LYPAPKYGTEAAATVPGGVAEIVVASNAKTVTSLIHV